MPNKQNFTLLEFVNVYTRLQKKVCSLKPLTEKHRIFTALIFIKYFPSNVALVWKIWPKNNLFPFYLQFSAAKNLLATWDGLITTKMLSPSISLMDDDCGLLNSVPCKTIDLRSTTQTSFIPCRANLTICLALHSKRIDFIQFYMIYLSWIVRA